jgi:hypothetical protein
VTQGCCPRERRSSRVPAWIPQTESRNVPGLVPRCVGRGTQIPAQSHVLCASVAGHVFISYSRRDKAYVSLLAAYLNDHETLRRVGLTIVTDRDTRTGAPWAEIIDHRLDTCAAVILVMTPDAERSAWVARELERARGLNKPVLPILLRGDRVLDQVKDLQYLNLLGGELYPGPAFIADLVEKCGLGPHRVSGRSGVLREPMGTAIWGLAVATVSGRPVLVSSDSAGAVDMWDLRTNTALGTLHRRTDYDGVPAIACAMVNGRPVVVTGGHDVLMLDMESRSVVGDVRSNRLARFFDANVTCLDSIELQNQPVLLTCERSYNPGGLGHVSSEDSRVRLWDLTTMTLRKTLFARSGWPAPTAIACGRAAGHPIAAFAMEFGRAQVWDLVRYARLGRLGSWKGPAASSSDVALGERDGQSVIVLAGAQAEVWDASTRRREFSLEGHSRGVRAVGFSILRGEPVAVTASGDHVIRIWSLRTHGRIASLTGHKSPIISLECSTVEQRPAVISGDAEGELRIWDLESHVH